MTNLFLQKDLRTRQRKTLMGHLRALEGQHGRLKPDQDIAREKIETRITELKEELKK